MICHIYGRFTDSCCHSPTTESYRMSNAHGLPESDVLAIDRAGPIVRMEMTRPAFRNALNAELVEALTDAIRNTGQVEEARVIILSGAGKVFSAGADLAVLQALQSATDAENRHDSERLAGLFESVRNCPLPVIARVHGAAIAGGCGLAAACDIAIADERTTFGFSEVRIGFVPAIILTYLRSRIGEAVLRKYLLTGMPFDGSEAARIGLIAEAVAEQDLDRRVNEMASHIASDTSRTAVAMTKRLFAEMNDDAFDVALERAVRMNVKARATSDCKAGVSAFLQKTDPPWKRPDE